MCKGSIDVIPIIETVKLGVFHAPSSSSWCHLLEDLAVFQSPNLAPDPSQQQPPKPSCHHRHLTLCNQEKESWKWVLDVGNFKVVCRAMSTTKLYVSSIHPPFTNSEFDFVGAENTKEGNNAQCTAHQYGTSSFSECHAHASPRRTLKPTWFGSTLLHDLLTAWITEFLLWLLEPSMCL